MPINPAVTTPILAAALSGCGIAGQASPQFAAGVALGFYQYANSAMTVLTVDVGTAGSGTGTGSGITLTPAALTSSLTGSFAGANIHGIAAPQLIAAFSAAFSSIIAQAIVESVHAGVGVGTGIVQIIPNSAVSVPTFTAALQSAGLNGVSSAQLASGIALGLDAALPSAKGVVAIIGPPSTYPASGTGKGILL